MSQDSPVSGAVSGFFGSVRRFFRLPAASGIILLVCTLLALVLANSSCAGSYFALWKTKLTIGTSTFGITESLLHWINDALMAVFFFLIGLEIKREVFGGQLSSLRAAALPLAGAVGGMVVPAGIYIFIAMASERPRLGAGGRCPWQRTSHSHSECLPCSASARRLNSKSFSPRWRSPMTSLPFW